MSIYDHKQNQISEVCSHPSTVERFNICVTVVNAGVLGSGFIVLIRNADSNFEFSGP